jgi:hypothetical protein
MKAAFAPALALVLVPAQLFAETAFERMVGTWRGDGRYTEGATEVKLRCQLGITGDASMISVAGRCGSALGAEDFTMEFEAGPESIVNLDQGEAERGKDSKIEALAGPLGNNGFVVQGTAEDEEWVVQLIFNDDGTLVFATREARHGKTNISYVTLVRQ